MDYRRGFHREGIVIDAIPVSLVSTIFGPYGPVGLAATVRMVSTDVCTRTTS